MERFTVKTEMEHLRGVRRLERQAIDGRRIRGLAAAWDDIVESLYGPTKLERGAFTATLANRGNLGAVRFFREHEKAIGLVTSATETPVGLSIIAEVSETALGDESLTLARDGALDSLSVGFNATEFHWKDDGQQLLRIITAAELLEISLVPWGASPSAKVKEVYGQRRSDSQIALEAIIYMERLVAQYGPRPAASFPAAQTPLMPPRQLGESDREYYARLERRMQGIVSMYEPARYYAEAQHKHRMARADFFATRKALGY